MRIWFPAFVALSSILVHGQESRPSEFRFALENVLGTSMELAIIAPDEPTAKSLEGQVRGEIDRLAAILSSHDPASEWRKLLASGGTQPVSADLKSVLEACDRWRESSHGAFHPGVGRVTALWSAAQKTGTLPADADLVAARSALEAAPWTLDTAASTATVSAGANLTLDALAKGYIIDKASMKRGRGATVSMLEIGGDLRLRGRTQRLIAVRDPRKPADNSTPLATVRLKARGLATSGGYQRFFDVGGRKYSHIIDPRTARPTEKVLGATVIAKDATTADALATALCVLDPAEGLALVAATEESDCIIVAADGTAHTSPHWNSYVVPDDTAKRMKDGVAWLAGGTFVVRFEIRAPEDAGGGERRGGYRRPYVAVWVETKEQHPVRTLCLWMQEAKWLNDLRRWSRLHKERRSFADEISQATRKPGAYELEWDGRDDDGVPLPAGDYVIHIEAVREHGTYQHMSQPVTVGGESFEKTLGGNAEIKSATITYQTRSR